jgi:hypothetical protein
VNVLDENILESQRQLLRNWGVPVRQIGFELGRKGMADEEIIPFLLTLRQPTLLTRDLGLYDRSLCHSRYCLAILAVRQQEAGYFARAFVASCCFEHASEADGGGCSCHARRNGGLATSRPTRVASEVGLMSCSAA